MSSSFVTRSIAVFLSAIGLGFLTAKGTVSARPGPSVTGVQGPSAQQSSSSVRTVPGGTRIAGDPGKKGDTYYWLESRTERLTTRFADAVVVAERGPAGELRAKVSDADGNEGATFTATSNVLHYVPAAGTALHALNDSGERPTLDWANRQAYALWKDRPAGAALAWKGGVIQPRAAPQRDLHHEIVELETEWADGLSVRSRRRSDVKYSLVDSVTKKNRLLAGTAVAGRVTKNGVEVGRSAWFERDKVFMWNIPNLTQGYIAPEHLKDFAGWPFTPDPAWINLQTLAFYHFKSLINTNGFVARAADRCPGTGRESMAARVADFFVPTLRANEPGCDGLHWLDGSVFRFCCDVHDLCYERVGCSYHSWWQIWTSWRCDACNAFAVWCFAAGGCTCYPDYGWLEPTDDRRQPAPRANT